MAFTPRTFRLGDRTEVANSYDEEAQLLFDGWMPDGEYLAIPRRRHVEVGEIATLQELKDAFGSGPSGGKSPLTGRYHATNFGAVLDGRDNSAAIQAALSAAASDGMGGTVHLYGGTTTIATKIIIPARTRLLVSDVHFDQVGSNSVFDLSADGAELIFEHACTVDGHRATTTVARNFVTATGGTGARVAGDVRILDWRGDVITNADTTDFTISELTVAGVTSGGGIRGRAINADNVGTVIDSVYVSGSSGTNIQLDGVWRNGSDRSVWRTFGAKIRDAIIRDCHTWGASFAGIFINSGFGCQINNCVSWGNTDYGAGFEFCMNSTMTGNICHDNSTYGASLFQNNESCSIVGGSYYGNSFDGVSAVFTAAQNTAGDVGGQGCSITGVTARGNVQAGINVNGMPGVAITGGSVRNNGTQGVYLSGAHGFQLRGTDIGFNTGDGVWIRFTVGGHMDARSHDNGGYGVALIAGSTAPTSRVVVAGSLTNNTAGPVSVQSTFVSDVDITARCTGTGAAAILAVSANQTPTNIRTFSRGTGIPSGVVLGGTGSEYTQTDGAAGSVKWVKSGSSIATSGWSLMGGGAAGGSDAGPLDLGLLGWTIPVSAVNTAFAPAAGVVSYAEIILRAAGPITNVTFVLGTAGAGVTNAYVGIYDTSGNLLASSADISATLTGAVGLRTVSMQAPTAPLNIGTRVLVAFLVGAATTLPQFHRANVQTLLINRGRAVASGMHCGVNGSGLTALPAPMTLSASGGSNNLVYADVT